MPKTHSLRVFHSHENNLTSLHGRNHRGTGCADDVYRHGAAPAAALVAAAAAAFD